MRLKNFRKTIHIEVHAARIRRILLITGSSYTSYKHQRTYRVLTPSDNSAHFSSGYHNPRLEWRLQQALWVNGQNSLSFLPPNNHHTRNFFTGKNKIQFLQLLLPFYNDIIVCTYRYNNCISSWGFCIMLHIRTTSSKSFNYLIIQN